MKSGFGGDVTGEKWIDSVKRAKRAGAQRDFRSEAR